MVFFVRRKMMVVHVKKKTIGNTTYTVHRRFDYNWDLSWHRTSAMDWIIIESHGSYSNSKMKNPEQILIMNSNGFQVFGGVTQAYPTHNSYCISREFMFRSRSTARKYQKETYTNTRTHTCINDHTISLNVNPINVRYDTRGKKTKILPHYRVIQLIQQQ